MCVAQAHAAAFCLCRYLFKVLRRWTSGVVYRLDQLEVYSHESARKRLNAYLTSLLVF